MKRELVLWFMENRDRYTPEALRETLIAARHRPEDVDLLLSTADLSVLLRDAEVVDGAKQRVTWIVIAGYGVAAILLGAFTIVAFDSLAVLALPFLAGALAIGGLIGVLIARGVAGATTRHGAVVGMVLSLIAPATILAVVAGICVATGSTTST